MDDSKWKWKLGAKIAVAFVLICFIIVLLSLGNVTVVFSITTKKGFTDENANNSSFAIQNNFMKPDVGTILPAPTSFPTSASSSAATVTTPTASTSVQSTTFSLAAITTENSTGTSGIPTSPQTDSIHVPPCPRNIFSDRPRSCADIQLSGHTSSGVYHIYPFHSDELQGHNGTEVYCDLLSDGGGWTVIQRRKEPVLRNEDFQKTWQEYVTGFGFKNESHWIGLDIIAEMTKTGDAELYIELTDWEGETRFAKYRYFRVANSSYLFKLYVTDYYGDAGDSLSTHNEMAFSTKDRDNDRSGSASCAQLYQGAWWYNECHASNLNGAYLAENNGNHTSYANGVNWYAWRGHHYSLKRTEMKIRSRHFGTSLKV